MYSFEIKQYKKTDDGVYLKVFIRDKEILDEIMKYKTKTGNIKLDDNRNKHVALFAKWNLCSIAASRLRIEPLPVTFGLTRKSVDNYSKVLDVVVW